jgi:integrase/recombinase XerD
MTLKSYLKSKYTTSTVKSYEREIKLYLQALPHAQSATYQDIINYINTKRKTQNPSSINRILQSIKKYYNYLVDSELREDNPAQFINLKDTKRRNNAVQKRLLSSIEIEQLWQHFLTKNYRYNILRNRNLSMISLLLFQGLRGGEMRRLSIENINLEKTQIYIPKSHDGNARTLALEPCQILPLYQYINEDRIKLLKGDNKEKALFISKLGRADNGETLHYLIESNRHIIKGKTINPKTIRMSVIAEQFKKGKSLQEVQYFAGHRYPSSTERYKSNHLQALQQGILKHHPLK